MLFFYFFVDSIINGFSATRLSFNVVLHHGTVKKITTTVLLFLNVLSKTNKLSGISHIKMLQNRNEFTSSSIIHKLTRILTLKLGCATRIVLPTIIFLKEIYF